MGDTVIEPEGKPGGQAGGAWFRDRRILAWSFFDFANTPFAVLVLTVAFPPYFKEVVLEGSRAGDFLWGLAGSISMAVVALTAPYAGAYADAARAKRRLLIGYALFTILWTLLLATVGRGEVIWGMVAFIFANIGYQGGFAFYNAFLPEISRAETRGRVSGLGIALGYVAALLALLVALPFYQVEEAVSGTATPGSIGWLFLLVAGFFLVFSLPAFAFLRDAPARGVPGSADQGEAASPRAALRRLADTITHLRRNRAPFRFLLSYLVYMEAIATMTVFTAIYARDTLGLSMSRIVLLFILSQLTAIPGSYLLGRLADRIGSKTTVSLCLVLWLAVLAMALAARGLPLILGVALLAGVATGALQTVSRSFMAELTPPGREAEFFGFYTVVGRFSAVIGPVSFGAVSSLSGSQRVAILLLGALLLVALALLQGVPVPGRTLASCEDSRRGPACPDPRLETPPGPAREGAG